MKDEDDTDLDPQEMDDHEIAFFLRLLMNDYSVDDIARVAVDIATTLDEELECQDCKEHVVKKKEFFLVHDELEKQVGLDHGRLCVKCFEKRLGRELQYFDFTKQMILSDNMECSPLLRNRMNSGLDSTLPE